MSYSVGIPVRNEENTIIRTLESILSQTVPPNNIHVCVNGSSDRTYDKVRDMSISEKKIDLLTSEPGKPNAWNRIVRETKDNTMMFCDGDVIINDTAAENMLKTLSGNKDLILVGGSNAYLTTDSKTIFSRYFTENLEGRPIKQEWVCGRLYMTRLKELYSLAEKCEIRLMPPNVINEDGLLELVTSGYREIIDSAYNLSSQVTTFHDWKVGFKRVLAGQKQLKKMYPQYFGDSDFSMKRLKNYVDRFKEIDDWRKKVGVTALFGLRIALNVYYKVFDTLDYSTTWQETKSTKAEMRYAPKTI